MNFNRITLCTSVYENVLSCKLFKMIKINSILRSRLTFIYLSYLSVWDSILHFKSIGFHRALFYILRSLLHYSL